MEQLFDGIGDDILTLLRRYVAAFSRSGTDREDSAARVFLEYFGAQPYFVRRPEDLIRYPLPGDPLGRGVVCAALRGSSPETVVMIHHYDVVGTEDYGRLAELACDPAGLESALRAGAVTLEGEAQADLDGGDFLFGHGACDMKGGGAVQMTLLSRLAERDGERFPGTLLVLGVPDEENLSAGMRAAVRLLWELRERWGLRYRLMINSEPHQRRDAARGLFSTGSTGKLLAFVYARGRMAHAGKAVEGLNPLAIMSRIVAATEGEPFTGDGAPLPTWLLLRDDKTAYDVSMPRAVFGSLSVLSFRTSPEAVLGKLRAVCERAFADCLAARAAALGLREEEIPWKPRVCSWSQLLAEAGDAGGEAWRQAYRRLLDELEAAVSGGGVSLADAHRRLLDCACQALPDVPLVVIGFQPPFYPAVSNDKLTRLPWNAAGLERRLDQYARRRFSQPYDSEAFYTGISDLSYGCCGDAGWETAGAALTGEMPLYGHGYTLPLREMGEIAMPGINIGPWGKDFHKLAERVCLSDLTRRTPELVYEAIRLALEQAGDNGQKRSKK